MHVEVDLTADEPRVRLRDAEDATAFAVVVRGDPAGLRDAVAPLGRLDDDGGHAFLRPAAVRALPGAPGTDDWGRDFDAMVAYAASKGWTDADGAVRAHVEVA